MNGPLVEHQKITRLKGWPPVLKSGVTVHNGDIGIGECRSRPCLDVQPCVFDSRSLDGLGWNGKLQTGSMFADRINGHPEDDHGTIETNEIGINVPSDTGFLPTGRVPSDCREVDQKCWTVAG